MRHEALDPTRSPDFLRWPLPRSTDGNHGAEPITSREDPSCPDEASRHVTCAVGGDGLAPDSGRSPLPTTATPAHAPNLPFAIPVGIGSAG
jgi:hypothetical protein